jgi:DNA-binding MarR family transcriptional regulator
VTSTAKDRDELAREAFDALSSLVLDNERRREVSEKIGLSSGRLRALRRVADQPLAMGDLSALLSVDPPNLTALVDDLERLGLVERRAHPIDRRVKLVAATPTGATMARHAQEILGRPPVGLAALSIDDLQTLVRILATVRGD